MSRATLFDLSSKDRRLLSGIFLIPAADKFRCYRSILIEVLYIKIPLF